MAAPNWLLCPHLSLTIAMPLLHRTLFAQNTNSNGTVHQNVLVFSSPFST